MSDVDKLFYINIGKRIREIRLKKGLSQVELAERANLSVPVISSIENSHSKIWLSTFAKVAEALEVSANDILRLNTPESTADFPSELSEILSGCTSEETESILQIARRVKDTFESQKNKYLN